MIYKAVKIVLTYGMEERGQEAKAHKQRRIRKLHGRKRVKQKKKRERKGQQE